MKNLSKIFIVGIGLLFVASMSYAGTDTSEVTAEGTPIHTMSLSAGAALAFTSDGTEVGAADIIEDATTDIVIDIVDNDLSDPAGNLLLVKMTGTGASTLYGSSGAYYLALGAPSIAANNNGNILDAELTKNAITEITTSDQAVLVYNSAIGDLLDVTATIDPLVKIVADERIPGSMADTLEITFTSVDVEP